MCKHKNARCINFPTYLFNTGQLRRVKSLIDECWIIKNPSLKRIARGQTAVTLCIVPADELMQNVGLQRVGIAQEPRTEVRKADPTL